jgi:hypothetical protein
MASYVKFSTRMSYVPGFRYDLFVSYASEDNVDGWVEKFQTQITGELTRLLGRPFSERTVFFDKLRLRVGQEYPEELDNCARDSALLVALLSPNYVKSDWCSRERQRFQDRLPPGASFVECLASVGVRPTGELPQSLRDAQRKSFYPSGAQRPWPVSSGEWIETVNQLAVDIVPILQKLRHLAGSVFVGSTLSSDMQLRERIADYLSQQKFRAAPDSTALLDDRATCQKALAEAACAVHFIGGASDAALQAIEDSIELCPGPTVVFQPFGTTLTAGEELFLSDLAPDRYPYLASHNETELKKFLEELLSRSVGSAMQESASLALVCQPSDFPWAEQFRAEKVSVDYPRFLLENLTNTDKIRRWRQMVRQSHGLLFYHGRSDESLLEKIRRLAEEEKSPAVRCWYLGEPDIDDKQQRRPSDPPYPSGLLEFLEKVRRSAAGAS